MALPSPFENVDDRGLVEACTRGDEDAFAVLDGRFGRTVRAIGHRVAEDLGVDGPVTRVVEGVDTYLRRNQFGPLRTWTGTRFAVFLSLVTREIGSPLLRGDATGQHTASGLLPTALVDDLFADALDDDDDRTELDRLSPYVSVMLRLRLHGLGATGIAAALGTTRPAVLHQLKLIAKRLGHGDEASIDAFRLVLGHAGHGERVTLALRTEHDRAFRHARRAALTTWDAFRDRAMTRRPAATRSCLSIDGLAALIDGSLRGPSRAQSEGHVAGCAHCADRLALLVTDQDVITPLRQTAHLPERVAQLATAVSTLRPELAHTLAPAAEEVDPRRTRSFVRIAKAVRAATSLARVGSSHPPWNEKEEKLSIPTDDEAPIVALEALVARAPSVALRAVDDHLARRVVGRRMRLLGLSAMGELAEARAIARDAMERSSPDPELVRDIDAVSALADGQSLPTEVLAERVRTLVPDVVRYVVELGR